MRAEGEVLEGEGVEATLRLQGAGPVTVEEEPIDELTLWGEAALRVAGL